MSSSPALSLLEGSTYTFSTDTTPRIVSPLASGALADLVGSLLLTSITSVAAINAQSGELRFELEALAFLKAARIGARDESKLSPWISQARRVTEEKVTGPSTRAHILVEHPTGYVYVDKLSGKVSRAYLIRQAEEANVPLSESECASIASDFVSRQGGYSTNGFEVSLLQRDQESPEDPGQFSFTIQPKFNGIHYDKSNSLVVRVDARTGALTKYNAAAVPTPPTDYREDRVISASTAEGIAVQSVARSLSRHEFFISSSTSLVVVSPPSEGSNNAAYYTKQVEANEGIVAYRIVVSTPSPVRDDLRDTFVYWVDAITGKIVSGKGGLAEHLLSNPAFDASKRPKWPENLQPVRVIGNRGKRSAFGRIDPCTGSIGASAKDVTLEFRHRVIVAKFDRSQNLLSVGQRIGRPTGHLADALRAVTR